ncbi:putative pentatricopeptide repeat-containing protein At1g09680 [Nicotiana sylvestris]|uniref:putative pentatricopeptide repeat-containing protein At1g09680 n=1 Tax=Nicotiana sylvestris TaxID=4096 RepID=UPI00388C3BFA
MNSQAYSLIHIIVSRRGKDSAFTVFQAILKAKGTNFTSFENVLNGLIDVYLDLGFVSDAIQCFRLIQKHKLRFPFQGCTKVLEYLMKLNSPMVAFDFYKEILEYGYPPSLYFFNVLMSKLCKEGKMVEARSVFTEIWKRNLRSSVVSFNSLVNGYCRLGDMDAGYRLKREMEERGILPDVYAYSALINGLCKNFWIRDANELFNEICVKGLVPNVVIFTTLINGYC